MKDGRKPSQMPEVIQDLQVTGKRLMEGGTENLGGLPGLPVANPLNLRRFQGLTTAVAAGEVEVVDVPTDLLQLSQGARHDELNVIRMGGDGDDGPATPDHSDFLVDCFRYWKNSLWVEKINQSFLLMVVL